jgi:hemoglobin
MTTTGACDARFFLPRLPRAGTVLTGLQHGRPKESAEGRRKHREPRAMEQTLFQKYGGFAKVSRIVLDLYNRLLDDDDLGPFFENVDMSRIVDHQTKFIASLLGGPASYTDDQIARMHHHLTINATHFDRLIEILSETLADHGMDQADIDAVGQALEDRRKLLVG